MTAKWLAERLLESSAQQRARIIRQFREGVEDDEQPDGGDDASPWEGEAWRDEEDIEDKTHEEAEEFSKELLDRIGLSKRADTSSLKSPPDAARDQKELFMVQKRKEFQATHEPVLSQFRQAAPRFTWWAIGEEDANSVYTTFDFVHGDAHFLTGRLKGGPRDGETINPATVARICTRSGIKNMGLISSKVDLATIGGRMAAMASVSDLGSALVAKYRAEWKADLDHGLDLTLSAFDTDYLISVKIPIDDPQALRKATFAEKIVDQVANRFRRVWPGVIWK